MFLNVIAKKRWMAPVVEMQVLAQAKEQEQRSKAVVNLIELSGCVCGTVKKQKTKKESVWGRLMKRMFNSLLIGN